MALLLPSRFRKPQSLPISKLLRRRGYIPKSRRGLARALNAWSGLSDCCCPECGGACINKVTKFYQVTLGTDAGTYPSGYSCSPALGSYASSTITGIAFAAHPNASLPSWTQSYYESADNCGYCQATTFITYATQGTQTYTSGCDGSSLGITNCFKLNTGSCDKTLTTADYYPGPLGDNPANKCGQCQWELCIEGAYTCDGDPSPGPCGPGYRCGICDCNCGYCLTGSCWSYNALCEGTVFDPGTCDDVINYNCTPWQLTPVPAPASAQLIFYIYPQKTTGKTVLAAQLTTPNYSTNDPDITGNDPVNSDPCTFGPYVACPPVSIGNCVYYAAHLFSTAIDCNTALDYTFSSFTPATSCTYNMGLPSSVHLMPAP